MSVRRVALDVAMCTWELASCVGGRLLCCVWLV